MNKDKDWLMSLGFTGFTPVCEIKRNMLPKTMGVYVVLRESDALPQFLERRTFSSQEKKYPSYPLKELYERWVKGAHIVYIGKAGCFGQKATLQSRIGSFLSFGRGKKASHGGGRSIWQLVDHDYLMFCWKVLTDITPCKVEHDMIADFMEQYGKRPFANLNNGQKD